MRLGYVLLYVEDVEKCMQFYQKAFGLEPAFLHESKQYGEMAPTIARWKPAPSPWRSR